MSFVAIFVALLLEQARPLAQGSLVQGLVRSWVRWTARNFDAGRPQHGPLAWSMAVFVPSLCVLLVYWALQQAVGWPAAVIWNIAVLYITLGFRQFSHHFTEIRNTLESGDEEHARQLLADWKQVDAGSLSTHEVVRQVVEYSVIAAHRHVFGVLAWFSVMAVLGLGPAGAVFYRLSEFVPRYWAHKHLVLLQPVSGPLLDVASRAWRVIDWLPARVTAMAFAVVGSFEDAIENWRNYEQRGPGDNDGVILAATAGAINMRVGPTVSAGTAAARAMGANHGPVTVQPGIETGPGQEPEVGHLRTVVGLVWRTVVMWLTLLALLTLARLLG